MSNPKQSLESLRLKNIERFLADVKKKILEPIKPSCPGCKKKK